MNAVVFFISYPFLYLVSILPRWLLYGLSDIIFFFLFHILHYRRKVVDENLLLSFPEKSAEERKIISRKFYRYLCDLFLETLQTLTMSSAFSLDRIKLDAASQALFEKYYKQKQSLIIVLGHYGNWE